MFELGARSVEQGGVAGGRREAEAPRDAGDPRHPRAPVEEPSKGIVGALGARATTGRLSRWLGDTDVDIVEHSGIAEDLGGLERERDLVA